MFLNGCYTFLNGKVEKILKIKSCFVSLQDEKET